MSEQFCSQLSLASGEPLAGSAVSHTDRILVIEHAKPWGPKGVDDSGLPPSVVSYLAQLSARYPRLRIQLARREQSSGEASARVFFAETGEGPGSLSMARVESAAQVPELAIEGWLAGGALPGTPETEPLFLVCVHGKRDRCCALFGLPVYRALSTCSSERVLSTTHLGGHRFAATLLALPVGICYGRVQPDECEALYRATRDGVLHDLSRVRGRICYSSVAQAAEVALRSRLNDHSAQSLRLLAEDETEKGSFRVRFAERARRAEQQAGQQTGELELAEHVVDVERQKRPPAPASCGAEPKPSQQLVAIRVSTAG